MEPFTQVSGKAAPMLAANIDTDVIMPKQFLKGIDRAGLDRGLFFDLRFLPSGEPNPDFILNQPAWQGAKFLVTGPNFGCGSSREHAVWGLKQMGIKALIGSSFAGIFYDNCQRNGVLTIMLDEPQVQVLGKLISQQDTAQIEVDLQAQEIRLRTAGSCRSRSTNLRKNALLLGLDAIGSTLQKREQILAFQQKHLAENPWL